MSEVKICTKCGRELPATTEYYYKSLGKYRPDCKECSGHKFMNRLLSKDTILNIDGLIYKTCLTCGSSKPISDYYFNVTVNDYNGTCKSCVCESVNKNSKKKSKESLDNRTKGIPDNNAKCITCGEIKPSNAFWSLNHYNSNKTGVCSDCHKSKVKKYEIENHEKLAIFRAQWAKEHPDNIKASAKKSCEKNKVVLAARNKLWYKRNPEWTRNKNKNMKAKRRGGLGKISLSEWDNCKKAFDYKCAYCGSDSPLEQEHVIPLSKNGSHAVNNVVTACRKCNGSKGTQNVWEWYIKQPFYSKKREQAIINYISEQQSTQTIKEA